MASGSGNSSSIPSKRSRPVQSCISCRTRKLKCDRELPCGQCNRSNKASDCTYDREIGSMSKTSFSPSGRPGKRQRTLVEDGGSTHDGGSAVDFVPSRRYDNGRLDSLERRVRSLETKLSNHRSISPPASPLREDAEAPEGEVVEVKGQTSKYHDWMSKESIFNQFESAKLHLMQRSGEAGTRKQLQDLRQMFPKPGLNKNKDDQILPLIRRMCTLLPSERTCEKLFDAYFVHWEQMYEILDRPTTEEERKEVYRTKDSSELEEQKKLVHAVPRTLLICAISMSFYDLDDTRNFMFRDCTPIDVREVCELVERWLTELRPRDQADLRVLQAQTLYVSLLYVNPTPTFQLWRKTGNLVRSAMVMGLHQDPATIKSMSVFHVELRRRLWFVIIELDLQTSLLCGLPPAVREEGYNCSPPTDNSGSRQLSRTRERQASFNGADGVDQTCSTLLARSKRLRLSRATLTQEPKSSVENIEQDRRLLEELQTSTELEPLASFGRALFEVSMHRSILSVNRPLFKSDKITKEKAQLSSTHSSLQILKRLQELHPRGPKRVGKWMWDVFFNMCSHDTYQAILLICRTAEAIDAAQNVSNYGNSRDRHSEASQILSNVPWSSARLMQVADDALEIIMMNANSMGGHLKSLIAVSVVMESVRARHANPTARQRAMDKGIERVFNTLTGRYEQENGSETNADNLPISSNNINSNDTTPPSSYADFDFGALFGNPPDPNFGFAPMGLDFNWSQNEGIELPWDFYL